jgi:hypothetical protein
MSDWESRYEDAKREAWEDRVGPDTAFCPECGAKMLTLDYWPQTRINPESGSWRCPECGTEREV